MRTRHARSRSRGGTSGGLVRRLALSLVVLSAIGVAGAAVVPTLSFTTVAGERGANVGVANDATGLVGIDLPSSVPVGGGGGGNGGVDCSVTNDTRVVHSQYLGDIHTSHGVLIESGAGVGGSIDADGCVVVESGGRALDDVSAGGDVRLQPGAQIDGDVEADQNVTLGSGSRILGDVDAGGYVTLAPGAQIDGDVTVDAQDHVSLAPGARILGDVVVRGNGDGGDGHHSGGNYGDGHHQGDGSDGSQCQTTDDGRGRWDGWNRGDQSWNWWGSSGDGHGNDHQTTTDCSGDSGGDQGGDSGGSTGPVTLATLTNHFGQSATVTVTLSDVQDGTLYAGGQSGSTVQVNLAPGQSTAIDIVPSTSGGSDVEFQVVGETAGGNSRVEFTRSVPKAQA